ncbi:MAG: hypothetical protein FWD45_00720, partial [Coriobacteriia bacterium]|nr:hypothetical protein [Coriobacteriia bacterium]
GKNCAHIALRVLQASLTGTNYDRVDQYLGGGSRLFSTPDSYGVTIGYNIGYVVSPKIVVPNLVKYEIKELIQGLIFRLN